jgi:hypothetical protein
MKKALFLGVLMMLLVPSAGYSWYRPYWKGHYRQYYGYFYAPYAYAPYPYFPAYAPYAYPYYGYRRYGYPAYGYPYYRPYPYWGW